MNNRNSKEHLDEMQITIRNKVGTQSFFMLYFLLMINLLLRDYGVKWASSSVSTLAIMTVCMGYFLLRIVWAGAYVSQSTQNSKKVYLLVGVLAVITTILAIFLKTNLLKDSINISDGGFLQLVIFFLVFFTIIFVFSKISRRRSDKGNE